MIRLALPKGRSMKTVRSAFAAAGIELPGLEGDDRRLQVPMHDEGFEILLLKDWDLPLYVEHGIADFGVVGSDVLEEVGGDLLVPARLTRGRCRFSLIGRRDLPQAGDQVHLATKYPNTAGRLLDDRPWGAEVLKLSGSVELAPLLDLAHVALDIVETGRTLRENHLTELEEICEVAPCLIANRMAFQRYRALLNEVIDRLEAAGEVE